MQTVETRVLSNIAGFSVSVQGTGTRREAARNACSTRQFEVTQQQNSEGYPSDRWRQTGNVICRLASSFDRSGAISRFQKTKFPEGYPSGQRGQTVNLLAYAFGGSNPPPSTIFTLESGSTPPSTSFMQRSQKLRQRPPRCGSSSMVEPQPSKLMVRVRFPSPAPLNCSSPPPAGECCNGASFCEKSGMDAGFGFRGHG